MIHDLTGGTGLREQEVLEVLKGMMEAGAASERHGGKIISHAYPYVYSPNHKFEEEYAVSPTVYTIDFAYIQKRRQFNRAAVILWKAISGEEYDDKLDKESEALKAKLAELVKSLESILQTSASLLESAQLAHKALADLKNEEKKDSG